jgi:hypothetical protein
LTVYFRAGGSFVPPKRPTTLGGFVMSLPDVVTREQWLEARRRLLLDLTALGRQEDWQEPKGRVAPVRGGDPTFSS